MPAILSFVSPLKTSTDTVRLPQSADHFVGIDAIRGLAAMAVVMLHACVPYTRPSMAGLSWSVGDTSSDIATVLFWTIEIVIMPIFLVIAGFFAARSMASRDPWSTMTKRLRRLGVPLGLAVVFLLPIDFYTWMLGWIAEGNVTVGNVRRLKFEAGVDQYLWGLCHLWFLQYLMTYIVILAATWAALCRFSSRSLARYGMSAAFLLAVISLTMRPEVVWGFQHAFVPVLSKWIYSGAFYAAGVFWFRLDPQLSTLAVAGKRLLGPGVLVTAAAVGVGIWWLGAAGPAPEWLRGGWSNASAVRVSQQLAGGLHPGGWWVRGAMAVLTVAAASLLTFGLIGFATAHIRRLGPRMSSLASASMMIYLLHHPVVGLTHIAAKFALPGASPLLKVLLATGFGVAAGWSVSWLLGCHRERVALRSVGAQTNRSREDAGRRAA